MCGTIHTEDSSSAQAVFSGYCGMQAGTTAFPSPSYLAGDVTYYITDLPSYSSLASCAQFAVSYPVMAYGMYDGDCPSAPKGSKEHISLFRIPSFHHLLVGSEFHVPSPLPAPLFSEEHVANSS
jgi:hypothetical protein